jgi:uncharacterized protein YndB with AHSA1/START domain
MSKLDRTLVILASPDRVWEVLTHADAHQLHSAATQEEITSAQKEGVGVTLQLVRRVGPLALRLRGRITAWENARLMTTEWTSGFPLFLSTRVQMILTPTPTGTQLRRVYEWHVGWFGVGAFVEMFLGAGLEREMNRLMRETKRAAES